MRPRQSRAYPAARDACSAVSAVGMTGVAASNRPHGATRPRPPGFVAEGKETGVQQEAERAHECSTFHTRWVASRTVGRNLMRVVLLPRLLPSLPGRPPMTNDPCRRSQPYKRDATPLPTCLPYDYEPFGCFVYSPTSTHHDVTANASQLGQDKLASADLSADSPLQLGLSYTGREGGTNCQGVQ